MKNLQDRINQLVKEGIFLGGPQEVFEAAGRKILTTLLANGLSPSSKVLDIGCGCLRGGYWLIHFLDAGCYFGIEPNRQMLDAGMRLLLEPKEAHTKMPKFDVNDAFDFSVFNEKFDFFLARSIWSHASKGQISNMLDGFRKFADSGACFITSYYRASFFKGEYLGETWVGRSHRSNDPGIVYHRFRWIREECEKRRMKVVEIQEPEYNFGNQRWLKITTI